MKRIALCALAASMILAAPAAQAQDKADAYYAELMEWVFEPCLEVVVAAQVADTFDQEAIDLGMKRSHVAMLMLAERDHAIRDLAETFASGGKDPAWEERRAVYPILLRSCLQESMNKAE